MVERRSTCPAPTSSRSGSLPPKSARSASPSPTRAKEFVTKVKSSRSSPAKPSPALEPNKNSAEQRVLSAEFLLFIQHSATQHSALSTGSVMADKNKEKAKRLQSRQFSVRSNVFGTAERPRLSVYRSSKHIYAQIIDD